MKETIIKHLTDLMTTVQMAHYKGRELGVRVHETGEAGVSIDLYNFEGDGKPVCDGLTFKRKGNKEPIRAFCISYDPDWSFGDVCIQCCDDDGGLADGLDIIPELVPEEVLMAITGWLEKSLSPALPREGGSNDVTSFFYYMWNRWSEKECRKVYEHNNWQHFWDKWCGICDAYGVRGATERFYAELSNGNRYLLVKRALECYDGYTEK